MLAAYFMSSSDLNEHFDNHFLDFCSETHFSKKLVDELYISGLLICSSLFPLLRYKRMTLVLCSLPKILNKLN